MELLWQKGHIVAHSLTNSPPTKPETPAGDNCGSFREAEAEQEEEYDHFFSQGDESALWLSYPPWMSDGTASMAGDDDAVIAVINNIGDAVDISSWLEKNRAPPARDREYGIGQGGPAGFWHRGADESMVVDPAGASVDAARAVGAVAPVSSGDGEIQPPPRKDRKRKHTETDYGGERDEVV